MSEMPTSGVNRAPSPPPPPQPVGSSFYEPVGRNWLTRTGNQPVGEWMRQLPRNQVGLSTIDRWLEPIDPQATVSRIETELRAAMGIQTSPFPTTIEMVQAEFNDIKLGHAMGSLAADLRQRIADNPSLSTPSATRFLETLDRRATALSRGAAAQATANPTDFSYNGTCYMNADAMARAVIQYQSTQPQMRAYTPEMALRAEYAALDRQMWNSHQPGLGYPWSATAYQYARVNGATPDQLRRATAFGQLADIGLGIGGSVAGANAARTGFTHPGGQPGYRPRAAVGAPLEPQSLRLGAQQRPTTAPIIVTPSGVAISPETLRLQGSASLVGDFRGIQGASIDEIIARVPANWTVAPQLRGMGIRFLDQNGIERLRLHGPSTLAPTNSNSAAGWTARVHVPGSTNSYFDNAGNIVGSRANEGHIPISGNPNVGP